ncbi:hypothetical protein GBS0709_00960 [Edwardsiella tarda]|nr:hypothetical protein GBS0709_00960 [Edwardsiella tarda]
MGLSARNTVGPEDSCVRSSVWVARGADISVDATTGAAGDTASVVIRSAAKGGGVTDIGVLSVAVLSVVRGDGDSACASILTPNTVAAHNRGRLFIMGISVTPLVNTYSHRVDRRY